MVVVGGVWAVAVAWWVLRFVRMEMVKVGCFFDI